MNEIQALRFRIAEAEKQVQELDLRIDLDRMEVRERLDPFIDDNAALKIEECTVFFHRLQEGVQALRELRLKIAKMREALGE